MISFFTFKNKFTINRSTRNILLKNDKPKLANSAAIGSKAFWNGGLNFTSVGTNGGPSYYGTFDQTGLVWEWCDSNNTTKVIRGGDIAGFGGLSNKYDSDKTRRYTKTTAGGAINPPIFLSKPNKNKGKPVDQDWGGRISSLNNPLGLNNFVSIGNTGNVKDNTGYGKVDYNYQISKYLLTNSEYCVFLNAKAASDPNKLYSEQMNSERVGGINRIGSSGSYTYSVKTNMDNKPVYFLSWYSLARYTNWLHNNYGSTETGVYTLNNSSTGIIVKNSGASYYIPTEDEWYKAAYFNASNGKYWSFATQSNNVPIPTIANSVGDGGYRNISFYPNTGTTTRISDSVYQIGLSINNTASTQITKITPTTITDPKLPLSFIPTNPIAQYGITTSGVGQYNISSISSGNIDLDFELPSGITGNLIIFGTDSNNVTTSIGSGINSGIISASIPVADITTDYSVHILPVISGLPSGIAYPYGLVGTTGVAYNGGVNLWWNIDNNVSGVYDYSIKYSKMSTSSTMSISSTANTNSWTTYSNSPSTNTSIVVNGLERGASYNFGVAAITSSGMSSYTTTSSGIKTPEASVPDKIVQFRGQAIGPGRAKLSWLIPDDNGSPIYDYLISCRRVNGIFPGLPGAERNNFVLNTRMNYGIDNPSENIYYAIQTQEKTGNLYTITTSDIFFADNEYYTFNILAINSSGAGPWSDTLSVFFFSVFGWTHVFKDPIGWTAGGFPLTEYDNYIIPVGATGLEIWAVGGGGGAYYTGDICDIGYDGEPGGVEYGLFAVSGGDEVRWNIGRGGIYQDARYRQITLPTAIKNKLNNSQDGESTYASVYRSGDQGVIQSSMSAFSANSGFWNIPGTTQLQGGGGAGGSRGSGESFNYGGGIYSSGSALNIYNIFRAPNGGYPGITGPYNLPDKDSIHPHAGHGDSGYVMIRVT